MATRDRTLEQCLALKKEYEDYLKPFPINDTYVVITGGGITNENASAGSQNPHECHEYKWQVKYIENPGDGTIIHDKWCITGDYPFDLSIEDPSGIIKGKIWILNEQPWVNDIIPREKLKYDGSNWNKINRPASNSYTCKFYVSRVYKYTSSTVPTPITYKTSPVLHTIIVVKSHSLDNYILAKYYLSEVENIVPLDNPPGAVKVNKMNFHIDNKYYGIDELEELLQVHPGPWPICGKELF